MFRIKELWESPELIIGFFRSKIAPVPHPTPLSVARYAPPMNILVLATIDAILREPSILELLDVK